MKQQREAEKVIHNVRALLADLKSCSLRRELEWGRRIHAKAKENGTDANMYVVTALISMYAKCGSMGEARRVFDSIHKPDVVSWSALLLGYAESGDGDVALDLFSRMKTSECVPNSLTYVAILKACTSLAVSPAKKDCLERGREIHSEIGCHLNHYVQSALIDMYSKSGSMIEARGVFDSIHQPDVVSWNALLLGYAEHGEGRVALDLFSKMKASGCAPTSVTYVAALKACASLAMNGDASERLQCLERGREIHLEIGRHLNHYVQSTLIDMYAKCGSMDCARSVFDSIQKPVVVSWNALLLGYAENGDGLAALDLFSRMKARGCEPDSVTYIAALKACGLIGALTLGRKFHSEMTEFTGHVVTCLVDFYAKCGSMAEAREVFDLHSTARDVSTWNALLAGYSSFGDTATVFNLFEALQDKGFRPDAITFLCMLLCCSHAGLIAKAREYLESMPVQYGVTPTLMHYNCMVDILGRSNQLNEAIAVLHKMPCSPDAVTWRVLLAACRKWKNVEIGRLAFKSLMVLDKTDASAYVLMAHIYGSKGMWEEQERVLETTTKFGASKVPGQGQGGRAYVTDEAGRIVRFGVGELGEHDLQQLLQGMKEHCYVAECYKVDRFGSENEEGLCGHSERRAAVYGILKPPAGEPVRVFKDARVCDSCHASIRKMSKVSGRAIMVRDISRFHVMVNGNCSCKE